MLDAFALRLWMLIDCVKRDFKKDDQKVMWIVVIVFAQLIGAIIHYFVIKRKDYEK